MAENYNPQMQGIKSGVSLIAFRAGREMAIVNQKNVNKETGEEFTSHSIAFFKPELNPDGSKKLDAQGRVIPQRDSVEWVAISDKLGQMTASEITAQRDTLQVVTLAESGNLVLCKDNRGGFNGEVVAQW